MKKTFSEFFQINIKNFRFAIGMCHKVFVFRQAFTFAFTFTFAFAFGSISQDTLLELNTSIIVYCGRYAKQNEYGVASVKSMRT